MKDETPKIFRILEKATGRGEFDAIVLAAVAAYGSLRSPKESQVREFGSLVAPAWPKVSPETQRVVAAALSHSPRVPREVVERLLAAPVEIAAPFLISSPVLTPADLAALAGRDDARIARILAAKASPRLPLRAEAKPAPAPADEAAAGRASAASVLRSVEAPPLAPDHLFEAPARSNASEVRTTLLRLARQGAARLGTARPSGEADRSPSAPPTLRELLDRAMNGQADRFFDGLAQLLGLPPQEVAAMQAEASGEKLAVALKALKVGPADAMSILMLLKPRIGFDVESFDSIKAFYRGLKPEDCRRLLRAAPNAPLPRVARPPEAAERPQPAGQPRAAFGRRQSRPGGETKAGKGS